MKKILKWLTYTIITLVTIASIIFAVAYYNRDQILASINEQLNKGINGKFNIEKIDFTFFHNFPNFSVTLHNVYLRGVHYPTYHKDIFAAEKVFLDIRLYPLLKKEVRIKSFTLDDASVFIFRTRDGYLNTDIFKPSTDSIKDQQQDEAKSSILLDIPKIGFRNVHFTYADSIKNKFVSFQFIKTENKFSNKDSIYDLSIKGKMHVDELTFNRVAGGFLINKNETANLNFTINAFDNAITINPSSLTFERSTVNLNGKFELQKGGKYKLNIQASAIYMDEAKLLLSESLKNKIKKFTVDKPVDVLVQLNGISLPGNQPNVKVDFQSNHTTFHYGQLDFSNLSFAGHFTNQFDTTKLNSNDNSIVKITHFSGKLENLPVQGNVHFTKLTDPVMDLSISTKLNSQDLNNQLDNSRFEFKGGTFTGNVKYSGKLSEYLDQSRTSYNGKLTGNVTTTNASLYYNPKKILLDKINMKCQFNEKKVTITAFDFMLNDSPIHMNGAMLNFIPFFIQPKTKGFIKLNVTSSHLDLTPFASPIKREKIKANKQAQAQTRKKVTDLFDRVYHILEFDLTVKLDHLTFKKFKAKDISGQVQLNNTRLEAKPIAMNIAGGNMNMRFMLSDLYSPISPVSCAGTLSNADIKDLFLSFNNFNQHTVQSDNLSGTLSANINFSTLVNEDYEVIVPSMRGTLDFKIREGGLHDFEPLQNMSNFLFKKRDFTDVHFAELNSSFNITGTALDIGKMEIQSTVLSLFLKGRYSFTDSTSLSVQIPLSNLKKRYKDYKPQNVGNDSKVGPSVFLHIYKSKDISSKVKIDYDMFKKWAKD